MSRTYKGRFAVALGSAMLLASLTVGSVLAGEVTGRGNDGQPTPISTLVDGKLHSICAFSGQNDGEPPEGRTAKHVQNWGQIPKSVRDAISQEGEHPGDACNGHTGFLTQPGGE